MRAKRPDPPDETRVEIARRRLAQLAASFDAELPPADDEVVAARPRIEIPHVRFLAAVGVTASVLLVWWLLSGRPQTSEPVAPLAFSSSPSAGGAAGASAPPQELIIDVVGKVRQPGIVTVPPGSRVYEVIEAAGGLKGRVDTVALNLARQVTDGEQILVGIDPVAVPSGGGGPVPGGPAGAKVNLNTATIEQLETLPGVGPVTGQAILKWKADNGRFASVDDLLDVKGIGEATLEGMRDLVVV